jgi:exonuclease III
MCGLAFTDQPLKCGVFKAVGWHIAALWISLLFTNMVCLEYSRGGIWNNGYSNIGDCVHMTGLRNTDICQIPVYRGSRGSGHKLPIPTIITPHHDGRQSRGVQRSNLIYAKSNTSPPLEAALLNARSVCNKTILINNYVTDNRLDMVGMTETWLKPSTPTSIIAELIPPGYTFEHTPRPTGGKGGGEGLLFRESFKARKETTTLYSSFEHMIVSLSYRSGTVVVVVIYRPPTVKKDGPTITTFLEEFPKLLEDLLLQRNNLVIIGDFNIHIEDLNCTHAKQFKDLLDSSNLVQSVSGSTHKNGHTLDLILSRPDQAPSTVDVIDTCLSDHYPQRNSAIAA